MTETAGNMLLQRITLAVDAGGYSLANIELAVKLATAFKAQLEGLFIEDTDLLQAADLPFSTEITHLTAQERRLDALSMQRSLRVKSLEFRDRLAITAEKSQVAWSFSCVQGRKMEAGLIRHEGSALMIVGHALTRSRLLKETLDKKRILLFDGNADDMMPVLEAVLSASTAHGFELTLVDAEEHASTTLEQILERIQQENPNLVLNQLDENELQRRMKAKILAADYVIASRQNPSEVLRWIIQHSVCPVVLLT